MSFWRTGADPRFVEHDGAADVVVELRAGEEDLAVRTAVLLRVLDTDRSETLANSTVGLVRRENTLAAARDSLGGGRQLVAELGARAAGEGYSTRESSARVARRDRL